MNGAPASLTQDSRTALAADLRLLARLHAAELPRDVLRQLTEVGFPDHMALRLVSPHGRDARTLLAGALAGLNETTQDELDADFAAIYLSYGYQASPTESVWFDEEQLAMQDAMFAVRDWYRKHDLASADWRRFPDDHLVLQLQFAATLLERDRAEEAARFLDAHLLRWIGRFAERIAARCQTRYYAGLALLTASYLEELRALLALATGTPLPEPEDVKPARRR